MKTGCSTILLALAVHAASAHAQIDLPATVSDDTFGPLLSGRTYVARRGFSVPDGKTLTVQANVVVKLGRFTRIAVRGTLLVKGSAPQPSWFTSINDNAVGVRLNDNTPLPTDWGGIDFSGNSDASLLTSARIRYCGDARFGAVRLSLADITMRRCTIEDCTGDALNVNNSTPRVEACAFNRSSGVAIQRVSFQTLDRFVDNTATGNARGDIIVCNANQVTRPLTLGPRNGIGSVIGTLGAVIVQASASLTLQAGTILKAITPGQLIMAGPLHCLGTSAAPVVITSAKDDDFGGDSLNDGPTRGKPAEVGFIDLRAGASGSRLRNLVYRYGDGVNAIPGALGIGARDVTLESCTVERCRIDGVQLKSGFARPLVIRRCKLLDNGGVPFTNLSLAVIGDMRDNVARGNQRGDHLVVRLGDTGKNTSIYRHNTTNGVIALQFVNVPVDDGQRLLFGPGLILKSTAARFSARAGGELVFDGRGDAPIRMTSIKDDTIGGDTNGDRGATTPVPGEGGIIEYAPGSKGYLAHVLLRFGGGRFSAAADCRSIAVGMTSLRVERAFATGIQASIVRGVAANWVAYRCNGRGIVLVTNDFDLHHATVHRCAGAGIQGLASYRGRVFNSNSWQNGTAAGDNYVGLDGRIFRSNGTRSGSKAAGNLFVDPMFVDGPNGDLHISPFSLLVGRGDLARATLWGVDFDGNSRILDHALIGLALPDMGAYEVAPHRMKIEGEARIGTTLKFTVQGPGRFAIYGIGPAVGGVFLPPFGVLITGNLSNTVLFASLPVGQPLSLPIRREPSWIGTRFGIQAIAIQALSPPAGNICNAYLATITD